MMNEEKQQALALAATIQALSVVHEVATQGHFDEYQALPLLQALVNYSPEDTLSAYGGDIAPLRPGLTQMKQLFSDNANRDIAQYLLAVLSIELKLVRDNGMRHLLQNELGQTSRQLNEFDAEQNRDNGDEDHLIGSEHTLSPTALAHLASEDIMAQFAEVYKQTASRTEPRIMIKGNHQFLQQETTANQIRAMLLAALRGAAFFRHYGGKRFDLMMKRGRYIEISGQL